MALVEIERQAGIATVWLNQPQKKNAVGFAAMRELVAAAKTLRADQSVRAVVLAGRGQTFCAGIDLADLNDPANRKTAIWELIKPGRSLFQHAALVWQDLPLPVLCAIEGHCLGAGVQLALGAVPQSIDVQAVQRWLLQQPGVAGVHDLHLWTLTSGMHVATAHLVVDAHRPAQEVLTQAQEVLELRHGIEHATLQTESGPTRQCQLDW